MPTTAQFRHEVAAYVRDLSEWRRLRYNDDLRDERNLRSADALLELALFIDQLPEDDPRIAQLAALTADGSRFVPGQQLSYEIGRYHFHDASMTPDGFLHVMISLAERDAGEHGRFGGQQAPGDNPWN